MKFDSQEAYTSSFSNRIRTVSGREEAEKEIEADIVRLEKLQRQIRNVVSRRDAEIATVQATIDAIITDRSSYLIDIIVRILKPKAGAEVRKREAEIARLKARRARLFGKEVPLDRCMAHLNELMLAARMTLSRIENNRRFHADMLERKKEERAAEKRAREQSLAPYRKRIELGEAALGKTRILASSRKKMLSRKHPCPYCGGPLGETPVADHIYPVARGGHSTHDNMVFVCNPCNRKKRDFTLTEFIHRYGLDISAVHERLIKQNKRF